MMDSFKLTTWNIEWSDKLLTAMASTNAGTSSKAKRRAQAIAREFDLLDADILVIGEGPKGEARAGEFFGLVAPNYDLVVRGNDAQYVTQGQQWVWFLIRKGIPASGTLLHLDRWREVTREASFNEHDGKWWVGLPVADNGALLYNPEFSHKHYRHPQALLLTLDGEPLEIIGGHFKSKYVNMSTPADIGQPGSLIANPGFVAEVIEARVKLSSEASDVRYYLDGRFKANVDAPIIVAGDFNDGPGKEMIEERFLLHDLIGNLQGDVFFAKRFLNHALFDYEEEQRWTVQFEDKLDPRRPREILLDHILFSQSFVGENRPGSFAFRASARAGLVEHDVHRIANADLPSGSTTSDHRPVSMRFVRRTLEG
jgi:hypothetical protein